MLLLVVLLFVAVVDGVKTKTKITTTGTTTTTTGTTGNGELMEGRTTNEDGEKLFFFPHAAL